MKHRMDFAHRGLIANGTTVNSWMAHELNVGFIWQRAMNGGNNWQLEYNGLSLDQMGAGVAPFSTLEILTELHQLEDSVEKILLDSKWNDFAVICSKITKVR